MAHGGTSLSAVAQAFLGSAEYAGQHPTAQSDRQFVDGLYAQGLGRAADAGGEGFWVGELSRGASRTDVAAGFLQGAEAQAHPAGLIEQGWRLA